MWPADVNAPNTYRCFVVRTGMQFEAWFGLPNQIDPRSVADPEGIPRRYQTEGAAYRAAWAAMAGILNRPITAERTACEIERVFGSAPKAIRSGSRSIPVLTKKRKASNGQ